MTREHERTTGDAVRLAADSHWRDMVDDRLERLERFVFYTLVTGICALGTIVLTLIGVIFSMMRNGR